jgi:hypothetical protein
LPALRDCCIRWPECAGEVRAVEDRAGEVCAGEVRAGEVRAGKIRAAELDVLPVLLAVPAPDNSDAGLHIGACLALGWVCPGLIGGWFRPRLMGVITDKRGQHLQHRGMVSGRVPGDAFQGIDAPMRTSSWPEPSWSIALV